MPRTAAGYGAVLLAGLLLAACSGREGRMDNPFGPSGMGGPSGTFASNGERIYFTAVSSSGAPISYTGGFVTGMERLTCAGCHGPTGRGSSSWMMGAIVRAPDITWPVLTGADPDMAHPPYTEATVKNAITKGVDPAGHPLDELMPRWSMSAGDLDDLVAYLKTLR